MPTTFQLKCSQDIALPREEVFAFFSDAANLQAITPDFLHFQMITPTPIVLRDGTLIDYRIRLFGIPLTWRTRIESFEPPVQFVDVQLRGPYRMWHHRHEFFEIPGGTRVVDTVDYQLPGGPLGPIAHRLWVRRTLERIFDFRREHLEKRLTAGAAADCEKI